MPKQYPKSDVRANTMSPATTNKAALANHLLAHLAAAVQVQQSVDDRVCRAAERREYENLGPREALVPELSAGPSSSWSWVSHSRQWMGAKNQT
jgi:hypothetical protein